MDMICELVGVPEEPIATPCAKWSNLFLFREPDRKDPPPVALRGAQSEAAASTGPSSWPSASAASAARACVPC